MFKSGKYYISINDEKDFFNCLKFIKDNNLKPDSKEEDISTISELENMCSIPAVKNKQCSLFIYEKNTYFWSNFAPDSSFNNIVINNKSIESKLREIFDNPDNVIACNTIEEKHKLFKLLNKLEYKTSSRRIYNIDCIGHYQLENVTIVSEGTNYHIDSAKEDKLNIIYFSDLINLIKE